MKFFKKSTMSLALTAAMVSGIAGMQQASAEALVSSGDDKVGDVLLFPYYTINNGFRTLVHVVNSSDEDTTIIKLRLRDYKESQDVLDFTVVLSPNDVFSGTINKDSEGNVRFSRSSGDTTCISPVVADGHYQSPILNENGHTGHIEVITMATISKNDVTGTNATTYPALNSIVTRSTHTPSNSTADCTEVDKYFSVPSTAGATADPESIAKLQSELTALYASNDTTNGVVTTRVNDVRSTLFGHFTILNTENGVQGGGRPTTVAGALDNTAEDFVSPCDETANGVNTTNMCAQDPKYGHFTFPHLLHVPGVNPVSSAAGVAAANVVAFNKFHHAIAASQMSNEWSINDSNGVTSEMIVTFPTKYLMNDSYAAATSADFYSATTTRRDSHDVLVGTADDTASDWNGVDGVLFAATNKDEDGIAITGSGWFKDSDGCVKHADRTFDREEQDGTTETAPVEGQTGVSGGHETGEPVVSNDVLMCNESNVVTFGETDGVTQVAGHASTYKIDSVTDLDQKFGWMNISMASQDSNTADIPMIGYTMWNRKFGNDAGANYGHIMNNVMVRPAASN